MLEVVDLRESLVALVSVLQLLLEFISVVCVVIGLVKTLMVLVQLKSGRSALLFWELAGHCAGVSAGRRYSGHHGRSGYGQPDQTGDYCGHSDLFKLLFNERAGTSTRYREIKLFNHLVDVDMVSI